MNKPELIGYWYEALSQKVGLKIKSERPDLLRAHLYAVRTSLQDPQLTLLQLTFDPNDPSIVWIVHKRIELDATEDGLT